MTNTHLLMPEDREHYDDDDDNEDATTMTTKCWCNSINEKKQNWYHAVLSLDVTPLDVTWTCRFIVS